MHICIIGAGAMGGLYGGMLARSGIAVSLFDTWVEHVAAINRDGLKLDGIGGDLRIEVPAFDDPASLPPADIAFVQTDTNATEAAAETAARVLKPEGWAVTFQNGIGNLETLVAVLGGGRVVGGLSYHSAEPKGPGRVTHTHAGPTWLGELDGRDSARVRGLAAMLSAAGFAPTVVPGIQGYIWNKFVHNCAINAVCAATGLRVGEIPMTPAVDELQTRVLREVLAVVAAKGIALPDPDPMATIKAFCGKKFNKPSMLQHVEAGKRTEIDALNGAVVREGAALGVPTPYNHALTLLVKGVEAQRSRAVHGPALDHAALEREAADGVA